jgi:hypothetical protein
MNATMEPLTIETDITRALRSQHEDLPGETARLEARLAQLRTERDRPAQAVQLLRVRVRAGLAKQVELDRATAELESIDNEIRSTEITYEDLASSQRVITMELAEQLARRRAQVAPQLTAEAKRRMDAVSAWLSEGLPLVRALVELEPAVRQFEAGHNAFGHVRHHRELPEVVVRAVNFWTQHYHGGCDVAALRERWREIAETVK